MILRDPDPDPWQLVDGDGGTAAVRYGGTPVASAMGPMGPVGRAHDQWGPVEAARAAAGPAGRAAGPGPCQRCRPPELRAAGPGRVGSANLRLVLSNLTFTGTLVH